jgi:hypothetical protein
MLKPLIAALAATLAITAPAHAQTGQLGTPTEVSFNLADLTNRQGFVTISPNYQVLIEFPELIDEVAFNQPQIVQYTIPKGGETRLYLNALKPTGTTDMFVIVGGKSLLFKLTIDPTRYNGTRKYTVRAPSGSPDAAPAQAAPNPSALVNPLPAGFTVNLTPSVVPGEGLNIPYALVNAGASNVIASRDNLMVYSLENGDRQAQDYRLLRTTSSGTGGIVQPNNTEVGLIAIAKPQTTRGELYVEWRFVEQSTRKTFTYRARIDLVSAGATN